MKIVSLENLLTEELRDIYSAEHQLIKALPEMAQAAKLDDLRIAFEDQLAETRRHTKRIEKICELLGISPRGRKCLGMAGLTEEADSVIHSNSDPQLLEAALIGTAQREVHYEIAVYGTARAHARQLGFITAADLLGQTLTEEKQADHLLTRPAENRVNVQVAMSKAGFERERQSQFPTAG